MASSRPPKAQAHDRLVHFGEIDVEEAEWVILFRALDQDERAAMFEMVRRVINRRSPPARIHMPASVSAAISAMGRIRPHSA